MNNIIDSIQLSGVTYTLQGSGGVTSGEVQTMIDESISGKVDTSAITSSVTSASTDSEIPTAKAVYDAIPTGGSASYSAGTNIDITNDTISCTIPAYFGANNKDDDIRIGTNITNGDTNDYSLLIGRNINKGAIGTSYRGIVALCLAEQNGVLNKFYGRYLIGIGRKVSFGTSTAKRAEYSVGIGDGITVYGNGNVAIGALASTSGGSSVAIGSGATANGSDYKMNLNNQIKVTPTNQVYIYNKDNTEMICLQDHLGGGGSSYSAGTGIDITNDVISVSGVVMSSAITTNITSSSTDVQVPSAKAVNDKLGGLSIVKLSQSEYDNLSTKDNSTLYVIVN